LGLANWQLGWSEQKMNAREAPRNIPTRFDNLYNRLIMNKHVFLSWCHVCRFYKFDKQLNLTLHHGMSES